VNRAINEKQPLQRREANQSHLKDINNNYFECYASSDKR